MTEYDLTNRRFRVIEPMNLRVRVSVDLGRGRRGGRQGGGVPEERRERGERRNCADDDEDNLCPLGHICVAVLLRQDHCSLHVSPLCSGLEHELRTVHGIPHNGREEARGEEGEEREEEDTRADGDAAAEVP